MHGPCYSVWRSNIKGLAKSTCRLRAADQPVDRTRVQTSDDTTTHPSGTDPVVGGTRCRANHAGVPVLPASAVRAQAVPASETNPNPRTLCFTQRAARVSDRHLHSVKAGVAASSMLAASEIDVPMRDGGCCEDSPAALNLY